MTYNRRNKKKSGNGLFFLAVGLFLLVVAGFGYGFYSWLTQPVGPGSSTAVAVGKVPDKEAKPAGKSGSTAAKDAGAAQPGDGVLQPVNGAGAAGKAVTAAGGTDYHFVIDKGNFTLTVYDAQNQVVKSYGVALGKNRGQKKESGDNTTPDGTFPIAEVDDASTWTHDFGDGKGEIKGAYGNWFLYLDTSALSKGNWDGIGIHGTHDPKSIGTLASEGCIRLHNEDIDELKSKYARVGTLVTIKE